MSILILYFLVIFQFYFHHECQLLVFISQSCHLISLFTIVHTLSTSCKLLLGTYARTATNPQLLYTHTCPVTEFAVASHLNTANSCCHHVFLRHFRFQKCLPVYSNNPQPELHFFPVIFLANLPIFQYNHDIGAFWHLLLYMQAIFSHLTGSCDSHVQFFRWFPWPFSYLRTQKVNAKTLNFLFIF